MILPVRILSDLHLGHRVSRISSVESLRPLIAGAGTIVFNGDTWQELARIFRERSAEMLEELKTLCAEEGAEPIFLSGNHDPGWPGEGWLELAGGKILITHGDTFFAEGSPWSREAFSRHEQVSALWARHGEAAGDPAERIKLAREIALVLRAAEYPKGKALWQRILEAVRPPRRAYEILRVWAMQAEAAADFAETYFPGSEIVIKGHFHRAGIWRKRGRLIINLGAYMTPCPAYWAEFDGTFFRYGRVDESNGYRMGAAAGAWRLPRGY